jgi:hypothetical protein
MRERDRDELWFHSKIKGALDRMEELHEPGVPPEWWFKALVEERRRLKRTLWRDLGLFWLASFAVLSVMFWLLNYDLPLFAVLQTAGLAGALWFVFRRFGKRVKRDWPNR